MSTDVVASSGFASWPTAIASAGPAAWYAILQVFAAVSSEMAHARRDFVDRGCAA